jgi:hypothetical protein
MVCDKTFVFPDVSTLVRCPIPFFIPRINAKYYPSYIKKLLLSSFYKDIFIKLNNKVYLIYILY